MEYNQVIVRAPFGAGLVRFVIDNQPKVVYIADNQGLKEVKKDGSTGRLVGFPRNDVFMFDRQAMIRGNEFQWDLLKNI